jgi:hypothetical protein
MAAAGVALTPDDPDRTAILSNLGGALQTRLNRWPRYATMNRAGGVVNIADVMTAGTPDPLTKGAIMRWHVAVHRGAPGARHFKIVM